MGKKWYAGRGTWIFGPVRINTVWFIPTSVSVGGFGFRVNVGRGGRIRTSVKMPGVGGTWQKSWSATGLFSLIAGLLGVGAARRRRKS